MWLPALLLTVVLLGALLVSAVLLGDLLVRGTPTTTTASAPPTAAGIDADDGAGVDADLTDPVGPADADPADAAQVDGDLVDPVCAQALRRISSGRPQEALDLIARLRYQRTAEASAVTGRAPDSATASCARERSIALARIDHAEMLASAAGALEVARTQAGAGDPGQAGEAGGTLARLEASALDLLGDPCPTAIVGAPPGAGPEVEPLLETVLQETARSCDRALEPAAQPLAERAEERWTDFTENKVTPWQALTAVLLGVVATGLVLALLLTHAMPNGDRWHRAEPTRRWVGRYGFALLVGAGSAVPVAVALGGDPSALAVAMSVLLALVGVVLLAWAFSRSLAVSVAVTDDKGAEDHVAAGHVLALLHEMGSERPQGIQVPRGSDMTALQDAGLTTAPGGKVAAAAYRLLQLLVPRAPWQVRIDVESADVHAVLVRRNGRLVTSAVVAREALRLGAPGAADAQAAGQGAAPVETKAMDAPKTPAPVDLHTMSAAVILCTLTEAHHLPGLSGATDWRSVGLQYVATTDPVRSTPAAVPLLAQAVRLDPANTMAQYSLWTRRYRESTSSTELTLYIDFLERFIADLSRDATAAGGDETGETAALLLRARLALAVAFVNRTFVEEDPQGTVADAKDPAEKARDHAEAILAPGNRSGALAGLAREAKALSAPLIAMATTAPAAAAPPRHADWTPLVDYLWACHLASAPGVGEADRERAVMHLLAADADPQLATWRAKDPQLRTLRRDPAYLTVYGRTDGDLLSLPPLKPFEARLRRLGAVDPESLAQLASPEHRDALAAALGTPAVLVDRMATVAALLLAVPPALRAWRVEIGRALLDAGVERADQRSLDHLEVVRTAIVDFREPPLPGVLERWLAEAGTTAPATTRTTT